VRGTGQTHYERHPSPPSSTPKLLAEAAAEALAEAGLKPSQIDGLGISSFTLAPDRAIDMSVKLGMSLKWIMDGGTGGASGIDLAQHARRAIQAGDASNVLLIGGDTFQQEDFTSLISNYNSNTSNLLSPLGFNGPNPLFAMITKLQMERLGLHKTDYGRLVCEQRRWAGFNPNATYRQPLSLSDYLAADQISEPLGLFDCVPVVAGANAIVLSNESPSRSTPLIPPVVIRSVATSHNGDLHEGDGTSTGLATISKDFWEECELEPKDVDIAALYDDYPAIVVAQLIDLGFIDAAEVVTGLSRLIESGRPALNTSGGQLSAGQCGAGAGLHGFVEVARALFGNSPAQIPRPKIGLVTGYGMVVYRYGASSNVMLLEATA
jgi:acetyl-CoA acetyltransferase